MLTYIHLNATPTQSRTRTTSPAFSPWVTYGIPFSHGFFGFTGSSRTMSNVQMGPKNSETNHHPKPLLHLLCARPALMSDSVSQPTPYSLVFCIIMFCIKYSAMRRLALIRLPCHAIAKVPSDKSRPKAISQQTTRRNVRMLEISASEPSLALRRLRATEGNPHRSHTAKVAGK